VATPAIAPKTCTINVNLFSGARTALPAGANALLTMRNGNQQDVPLPNNGYASSPQISVAGLPFFDNFADNYAVVASAKGYEQAGFSPVAASPDVPGVVDIMLLGNNATFNFREASWSNLKQNYPCYASLLAAGAENESEAADRYSGLMEERPAVLACYFNLVTAMAQIHLPVKTPLEYIKELVWDETMAQDRFFAWADPAIIGQIVQAAGQGEFTPEVGTALFHSGATRSWKQVQFGEANVQLTFHEKQTKAVAGVQCVLIEPDIDYYKDLAAHALLEVVANKLTNSLTDPRQVYVLRWIAGRHAGIPNFEPPYTIE
jgi:hypothetical protein